MESALRAGVDEDLEAQAADVIVHASKSLDVIVSLSRLHESSVKKGPKASEVGRALQPVGSAPRREQRRWEVAGKPTIISNL